MLTDPAFGRYKGTERRNKQGLSQGRVATRTAAQNRVATLSVQDHPRCQRTAQRTDWQAVVIYPGCMLTEACRPSEKNAYRENRDHSRTPKSTNGRRRGREYTSITARVKQHSTGPLGGHPTVSPNGRVQVVDQLHTDWRTTTVLSRSRQISPQQTPTVEAAHMGGLSTIPYRVGSIRPVGAFFLRLFFLFLLYRPKAGSVRRTSTAQTSLEMRSAL